MVKDLSVLAAFHRNYHDLILSAVWPSDSPGALLAAPSYFDYQAKVNYKIASGHRLEVFGFGSRDLPASMTS